jgi:hypothetical protein
MGFIMCRQTLAASDMIDRHSVDRFKGTKSLGFSHPTLAIPIMEITIHSCIIRHISGTSFLNKKILGEKEKAASKVAF